MKPPEGQSAPNGDPELELDDDCGCAELPPPSSSRVVHAWRVLRGRELTNVQLQAEWLEYKMIFTDILTRFSAQLARDAKSARKKINKQLELTPAPPVGSPVVGARDKNELRRRAAALRGITFPRAHTNGGDEP